MTISQSLIMSIPLCDRVSSLRRGDPGLFAIWFASILPLYAVDVCWCTQSPDLETGWIKDDTCVVLAPQESKERKGARPERLQRAQEEFHWLEGPTVFLSVRSLSGRLEEKLLQILGPVSLMSNWVCLQFPSLNLHFQLRYTKIMLQFQWVCRILI